MRHMSVSASTACNGTTKTSLGTITLPPSAKRIVGFWAHAMGGAGNTTLENRTGICEIECTSLNIQPFQFPLDIYTITGTGVGFLKPTIWNCEIQNVANQQLVGYVTLDLAQSIAGTGRWGVIWED